MPDRGDVYADLTYFILELFFTVVKVLAKIEIKTRAKLLTNQCEEWTKGVPSGRSYFHEFFFLVLKQLLIAFSSRMKVCGGESGPIVSVPKFFHKPFKFLKMLAACYFAIFLHVV
jgi:hypothetical protein